MVRTCTLLILLKQMVHPVMQGSKNAASLRFEYIIPSSTCSSANSILRFGVKAAGGGKHLCIYHPT